MFAARSSHRGVDRSRHRTLDGYNIIENGPERIFRQFESETQHRQLMERRSQTYPLTIQLAGHGCALIFALAVLGVTMYAIHEKAYWVAGLFGTGVIGVVVTAFIRASQPDKKPPNKP